MEDLFSQDLFGSDANAGFMQSLAELAQVDGTSGGGNNFFRFTQPDRMQVPVDLDVSNGSSDWSLPNFQGRAQAEEQVSNLCPFSDQPLLAGHQDLSGYRAAVSSVVTPTSSLSGMLASSAEFSDASPSLTGLPSPAPSDSLHRMHKPKTMCSTPRPAGSGEEYKTSHEYRMKRDRNNAAVRKSRIKAKQKSKETEEEVTDLRQENFDLKRSLDALRGQLKTLRALQPDLFDEEDDQQ